MAIGVFPAMKLGVLLIKQISKPITKLLVNQAKNHPVFRTYIIIPPANLYHWAEVKTVRYLTMLNKSGKINTLREEEAIELGASLLGEVLIFSIAGGCLLLEYSRQQAKESKKEQLRLQQLQKITDDIQGLFDNVTKLEKEIQYLNAATNEINKKTKCNLPLKDIIVENQGKSSEVKSDVVVKTNENIVERAIVYVKDIKGDKLS